MMKAHKNHVVRLARRPDGIPRKHHFDIECAPLLELGPYSVRVENMYLSVAPGDILKLQSEVSIGQTLRCYAISKVCECHPTVSALNVGDLVVCRAGWEEYSIISEKGVLLINESEHLYADFLTVLGPQGLTAYHGLHSVARVQKGQRILVNVASGVVGSIACQLASRTGLHVTAAVSSRPGRLNWVEEHLRPDKIILQEEFDEWAVKNTTFYDHVFENIGASSINAVIQNSLKNRFRGTTITLCGAISHYCNWKDSFPKVDLVGIMETATMLQGFQLSQFQSERESAMELLRREHQKNRIATKVTLFNGIEQIATALTRLYEREVFGKVLVRL